MPHHPCFLCSDFHSIQRLFGPRGLVAWRHDETPPGVGPCVAAPPTAQVDTLHRPTPLSDDTSSKLNARGGLSSPRQAGFEYFLISNVFEYTVRHICESSVVVKDQPVALV